MNDVMTDTLQKIVDAHTASLNAFAQYIREREADLKAQEDRRDERERELLQAVQGLRGEVRALQGNRLSR